LGCYTGSICSIIMQHSFGDSSADPLWGIEAAFAGWPFWQCRTGYCWYMAARWPKWVLSWDWCHSSPWGSILCCWHVSIWWIQEGKQVFVLKYLYPLCFCKILKVQFCILCACQPESDIFLPVVHQIRQKNYYNRRALSIAIFNSMEAWCF